MDWQDIETAPKDGTRILLFGAFGVSCGYWDTRFNGELIYDESLDEYLPVTAWTNGEVEDWGMELQAEIKNPTHWMPLPAPPEAK